MNNAAIDWLLDVVEKQKEGKTEDQTKRIELIRNQLNSLKGEFVPTITTKDIKEAKSCIEELIAIEKRYSSILDIADLATYDRLKKDFSTQLSFLGTIRGKAKLETKRLKKYRDRVNSDIFIEYFGIMDEITNKRPTIKVTEHKMNKSKKLRLTEDNYITFESFMEDIEAAYKLYGQTWQMVMQSVAAARDEKNQANKH